MMLCTINDAWHIHIVVMQFVSLFWSDLCRANREVSRTNREQIIALRQMGAKVGRDSRRYNLTV